MPPVGASSCTLISGSFDHFLEQKGAVGRPPEEKMAKWPVLQNEWSAVLLGAATPDAGSWESRQSCPLTAHAPSFK